jgi:hypothetical protein
MPTKRVVQTGQFLAFDKSGQEYMILVFTEFWDTSQSTTEGLKILKTSSGQSVRMIDKGKYEIVDCITVPITSNDPNAL